MACRRPCPSLSRHSPWLVLFSLVTALGAASCGGDDQPLATASPPATLAIVPLTSVGGSATTAPADPTLTPADSEPPVVTDPIITIASVVVPGTDPVAPTLATVTPPATEPAATPTRLCPGVTSLPPDAVTGDRISGDLDGDGLDDVVIAHTAGDGTPHVFVQRASGSASDIVVPLGNADLVSISFEDIDYSLGAPVAPPLVVLAIGAGPAGSAVATFASLNSGGCLQQWQTSSGPFTFSIDQRGPYRGLLCDGAAGRRFYVLRTATPDGAGSVATSSLEIDHTGVSVTLARLGDEIIPDDPSVQKNFGDIQNCDHPPLFP